MADVSITSANVAAGLNIKTGQGTAGATITAGQALYYDSTTGTLKLADSDVLASSVAVGIALHPAASGQPVKYITEGLLTIGGTLAVGETYVVSGTAGGIAPIGDLSTGSFTCILGIATTAAILSVNIFTAQTAIA